MQAKFCRLRNSLAGKLLRKRGLRLEIRCRLSHLEFCLDDVADDSVLAAPLNPAEQLDDEYQGPTK